MSKIITNLDYSRGLHHKEAAASGPTAQGILNWYAQRHELKASTYTIGLKEFCQLQ